MTPRLYAIAGLCCLAGCGASADPQLESVKAYVASHAGVGDVRVVRWWPAKPLPEYKLAWVAYWNDAAKSAKARDDQKAEETYSTRRDRMSRDPPPNVARMRYRTAKGSFDELFFLDDAGKITKTIGENAEAELDANIWAARKSLFPE